MVLFGISSHTLTIVCFPLISLLLVHLTYINTYLNVIKMCLCELNIKDHFDIYSAFFPCVAHSLENNTYIPLQHWAADMQNGMRKIFTTLIHRDLTQGKQVWHTCTQGITHLRKRKWGATVMSYVIWNLEWIIV